LAAKVNGLHIETSAKSEINVETAFIDLVKLIREREKVCLVKFIFVVIDLINRNEIRLGSLSQVTHMTRRSAVDVLLHRCSVYHEMRVIR
jgi:hypothetical protein